MSDENGKNRASLLGRRFFSSVAILSFSGVLVKLFGLFYKIPLLKLLGALGMGYFNCAYEIYAVICTVATSGLPVAMSILISSGGLTRERKTYRAALLIFSFVGALGTLLLFVFAGEICELIDNPEAKLAIMAISPSVFFVCVASVRRGYFQGKQNMTPTALSQLVEAVFKIAFGVVCATYAQAKGAQVYEIAAYAVLGVSLGNLISTLSLFIFRRPRGENIACVNDDDTRSYSFYKIVKDIFRISIPITLSSLVMGMTKLVDVSMIYGRLSCAGYSSEMSNVLYGSYTTLAIPIFNLVPSLIASVSLSLVPMLSEAVKRKDREEQHALLLRALKLTCVAAIPASFGICVFSSQILSLIFFGESEAISIAAPLLSCLGVSVLFSCLIGLTNAALQAYGASSLPIVSMLIGGVFKVICSYVLIAMPSVNIYGAPIGTLACNIVVVAFNFCFLAKRSEFVLPMRKTFVMPTFAAAFSVGIGCALYVVLSLTRLSLAVSTLASIVFVALVYSLMLLLLGIVKREDLDLGK